MGAAQAELGEAESNTGKPLAAIAVAIAALGLLLLPAAVGAAIILGRTLPLDLGAGTWFSPLVGLQVLAVVYLVPALIWAPRLVRSTAAEVD